MASATSLKKPRVLLFDIGGVCVVSPMQAILDYEKAKQIPLGWVNHSIAASNPHGAWQQLERGEAKLDAAWFSHFRADLTNEQRWQKYYTQAATRRAGREGATTGQSDVKAPPVPDIDAESLFWEMMRVARQSDPFMFPALKRLRKYADDNPGEMILAAMSNTSIFPDGHPFNESEGEGIADVKKQFDVFVSSAHVGMRKPADDIYYYTIGRVAQFMVQKGYGDGVRATEFVFLDDIGGNLKTAKKLGMGTIKVGLGKTRDAVIELQNITGLSLLDEQRSKL